MLDLKPFCAAETELRASIQHPWSRGQYSYASNGHIIIRVPRRDDIPENDKAPNAEHIFDEHFVGMEAVEEIPPVPQYNTEPCEICRGSGYAVLCDECGGEGMLECDLGHEHDCPQCDGQGIIGCHKDDDNAVFCERCDGLGSVIEGDLGLRTPVVIDNKHAIALKYMLKLKTLPNVQWNIDNRKEHDPIPFRFDGGYGLLMPMRMGGSTALYVTREKAA